MTLALLVAGAAPPPAKARVIARDPGIARLYAVGGSLLYQRTGRSWSRVVDGRRRPAGRLKGDVASLGRDRSGRVVAVERDGTGWRLYDLARDRSRPLRGVGRPGCFVQTAAIWRARIATLEQCGTGSPAVVLRAGRRLEGRLRLGRSAIAQGIALRGGSLAAQTVEGALVLVRRLADRGRWCPAIAGDAGTSASPATAGRLWLGTRGSV